MRIQKSHKLAKRSKGKKKFKTTIRKQINESKI